VQRKTVGGVGTQGSGHTVLMASCAIAFVDLSGLEALRALQITSRLLRVPHSTASIMTNCHANHLGSVPFSMKEMGDGHHRKSPRHNGLTGLVRSWMVCWRSHGHRCVPSGDFAPMMPQPTFIENGIDPIFVTSMGS
jgi:hypothetical protein